MEQLCPVCGARFPDHANVCDQHGVSLHPAGKFAGMSQHKVFAIGVLATLSIGVFALRAGCTRLLSTQVEALEIRNPGNTVPSSAVGRDLARWLAGKNLHFKVRARNGSPLELVDAKYAVFISSVRAAQGTVTRLGAHSTADFEFDIPLADFAVRNALLHPPAGGFHLEVQAEGQFLLFGIRWPAHVSRRYRLQPVLAL